MWCQLKMSHSLGIESVEEYVVELAPVCISFCLITTWLRYILESGVGTNTPNLVKSGGTDVDDDDYMCCAPFFDCTYHIPLPYHHIPLTFRPLSTSLNHYAVFY